MSYFCVRVKVHVKKTVWSVLNNLHCSLHQVCAHDGSLFVDWGGGKQCFFYVKKCLFRNPVIMKLLKSSNIYKLKMQLCDK